MNEIKYVHSTDYVDFELMENAVYDEKMEYPLFKSQASTKLHFESYHDIKIEILKYPLSVIKLTSKNNEKLNELSEIIENNWKNGYSDFLNDIQGKYNKLDKYTFNDSVYLILKNDEFNAKSIIFPNGISSLEQLGCMNITKTLKCEMEELDQNLQSSINVQLMLELMHENTDMQKYIEFVKENVKNEDLDKSFFFDDYVYDLFAKNYVELLEENAPYKFNQYGRRGIVRFLEQIITGEVHDECRCSLV
ncbi:hypothetical protein [Caviibacter abscessus]|uniref:hypothetical protein n=1 Tax=Caviibacter abscessus TaxID=1766719 RepID=UPI0008308AAF|nr:hypothetical protein [Caviibacter abscessus]